MRLARELGAVEIRAVATAAVREASNGPEVAAAISAAAGVEVEVLSGEEEGRLSFIGATKALGHPVDGPIGVVDIGGGSTEVILGTVADGVDEVRSWHIGSGDLADELVNGDPPSAAEIRRVRDHIEDFFDGVEIAHPDQAVAVGGSATSLRRLVGAVLEYETLERGDPRPLDRIRPPTSPAASSSIPAASASSPPASSSWRRSPSCSASPSRSARAASARASSSTSERAAPRPSAGSPRR